MRGFRGSSRGAWRRVRTKNTAEPAAMRVWSWSRPFQNGALRWGSVAHAPHRTTEGGLSIKLYWMARAADPNTLLAARSDDDLKGTSARSGSSRSCSPPPACGRSGSCRRRSSCACWSALRRTPEANALVQQRRCCTGAEFTQELRPPGRTAPAWSRVRWVGRSATPPRFRHGVAVPVPRPAAALRPPACKLAVS